MIMDMIDIITWKCIYIRSRKGSATNRQSCVRTSHPSPQSTNNEIYSQLHWTASFQAYQVAYTVIHVFKITFDVYMARLKSRINPQLSRLISRLIVLSTCVLNLQIPSNGPLCEVLSTLGTAKKWSSVRKLKWSSQWSRTKHNKEEICRDQESLVPWLKWSWSEVLLYIIGRHMRYQTSSGWYSDKVHV